MVAEVEASELDVAQHDASVKLTVLGKRYVKRARALDDEFRLFWLSFFWALYQVMVGTSSVSICKYINAIKVRFCEAAYQTKQQTHSL